MKGKREMRKGLLPKHYYDIVLRGFEEDDDKKSGTGDGTDDGADGDEEEEEDDKGGKEGSENTDGLKSALQKERRERKRLEKEARELKKFKEEAEGKDKSDTDKAKEDASKAESKAQKLAAKLRDSALDNAIIKAAGGLKFRDIDDALKLVDRGDIDIEQDDDDPTEIELDEASVKAALEKLAKAKPHLIVAEGQGERSGSKFNGGKKPNQQTDEEVLRSKYPALNRSGHTS